MQRNTEISWMMMTFTIDGNRNQPDKNGFISISSINRRFKRPFRPRYINVTSTETGKISTQKCIPVGCIPSAAMAVWPGGCLPREVSAWLGGGGLSAWSGGVCLAGGVSVD